MAKDVLWESYERNGLTDILKSMAKFRQDLEYVCRECGSMTVFDENDEPVYYRYDTDDILAMLSNLKDNIEDYIKQEDNSRNESNNI